MDLPKIGLPEGGMLGGLKSKLGLGARKDDFRDDDFDENAGYGDYDDYDDYDGYDDYDNRRDARASYGRGSYDASPAFDAPSFTASSRGNVTRPRLVSIDDVRANTQLEIKSRSDRDGHAPVESAFDSPEWNLRSEGLNSLFSPTTDAPAQGSYARQSDASFAEKPAVVPPLSEQPTLRPAGAGYDAFAPVRPAGGYTASRSTVVVKPQSYADVEGVAKVVRGGNVVVLNLRSAQESLSKRLLDFSFGVASALDARVDCVADKVFVICAGEGLTQAELQGLRNQGAF